MRAGDEAPSAANSQAAARAPLPEPLVERQQELETLDRVLAEARAGLGRTLIIRGAAGVGKTRLLMELRARAQGAGDTTLTARGGELEQEFPFGCVRQLFDPLLRAGGKWRGVELLAGDARLAEAVFASPGDVTEGAADPGYGILHGLYWLTANLAERNPLLLALDDAHWADAASLRYLAFLTRRLEGVPALAAVTMRPAEAGAESDLLRELARDPATVIVDLAPLSESGVAEVVRASVGDEVTEDVCALCHYATGGNPFLLRELLRDVADAGTADLSPERIETLGPDRIAEAVSARLERIGAGAVAIARAAAVLGDGVDVRSAAELAELDEESAAGIADELAGAGILDPGRPLRFAHPIVRNAVYGRMAPAEHDRWHRRAAAQLAGAGEPAETTSLHLLATEPAERPESVRLLCEAAAAAASRGAPDAAIAFLRRALAEPPPSGLRGAILTNLGTAELMTGAPEALGHLTEAMDLAAGPEQRAEAAAWLAQGLVLSGRPTESIEVLGGAASDLPPSSELGRRLEGELFLAGYINLAARRLAIERYPTPDHLIEASGNNLLAAAALETALREGPAEKAARLALTALDDGRLLRELGPESPAFFMAPHTLYYCDRFADAEHVYSEVIRLAGERGSVRGYAMGSCWRAGAILGRGAVPDAEADARAFFTADVKDLAVGVPIAAAFLIEALVELGQLDAADAILERSTPDAEAIAESPVFHLFLEVRGMLKLVRGDGSGALEDFAECGRREEAWGIRTPAMTSWRAHAAGAALALGKRDEARRLADEAVGAARDFGAPRALGIAQRAAGIAREGDERIELLREAVATLEPSPARLEHARALIELGGALRRANHQSEAREPLRDGLDQAQRCGASALADKALDELVAAGARPRRPAQSQADELTPSERRVAGMAAEGMSNKEIAQSLFVTVNTVETHLKHAYRKLDISSRTQLARRLARGPDGVSP